MQSANYKAIVEMQHSLNINTVGKNYLNENLGWNNAVIDESSEMLTSLGYKWWKKQIVDIPNVKVEAVDLLHFIISEDLQNNYDLEGEKKLIEKTAKVFEEYFEEKSSKNDKKVDSITDIKKLVDILNYHRHNRFYVLKRIFKVLGVNNEKVYANYMTKNCLNQFRQDNGYKEGTYKKEWGGVEDNVIANQLSEKIAPDENFYKKMYASLLEYYSLNVR